MQPIETNFDGRGLPTHLKDLIDSLPEHYFIPRSSDRQTRATVPQNFVDQQPNTTLNKMSRVLAQKQFVERLNNNSHARRQRTAFLTSIHYPEPSTVTTKEHFIEKVAREQAAREQKEKQDKEEKRRYVREVIHPLQKHRISLYDQSSKELGELQKEFLQHPPMSLLDQIYKREMDSPLVLHMLYQFERKSGQLTSEKDKSELLSEVYGRDSTSDTSSRNSLTPSTQNKDKDDSSIEIQALVPDLQYLKNIMNNKGIEGLSETISNINEQRIGSHRELEAGVNRRQLMLLRQMMREHKLYQTVSNQRSENEVNPWKEYLYNHFIKPNESQLTKMKVTNETVEKGLPRQAQLEQLKQEQRSRREIVEFQKHNPIVLREFPIFSRL